jgi:hypothetical protein
VQIILDAGVLALRSLVSTLYVSPVTTLVVHRFEGNLGTSCAGSRLQSLALDPACGAHQVVSKPALYASIEREVCVSVKLLQDADRSVNGLLNYRELGLIV